MKTLTAFCDLKWCPVSYDFAVWLVRAMMERDARGCDSLHVVLVPNEGGLGGFSRHWGAHDEAAALWRFWHIVMAMIPMAGATVTLAPSRDYALRVISPEMWFPKGRAHVAGPVVDACRAGAKIPKLRPTEAAKRYVSAWFEGDTLPLVTLTTRQQDTEADRNSNHEAWEQLGDLIHGNYRVVELQDSNVALSNSVGAWPELDADLRCALYERAAMNLIGNNGPSALMIFSEAPYIQFGIGVPGKWIEHMATHVKLKPGESYPWSRPDQRLVWKPDSFEVMKKEFEAWASATA